MGRGRYSHTRAAEGAREAGRGGRGSSPSCAHGGCRRCASGRRCCCCTPSGRQPLCGDIPRSPARGPAGCRYSKGGAQGADSRRWSHGCDAVQPSLSAGKLIHQRLRGLTNGCPSPGAGMKYLVVFNSDPRANGLTNGCLLLLLRDRRVTRRRARGRSRSRRTGRRQLPTR